MLILKGIKMRIIELYQDYNILFKTEGKNCSPGWVVIKCPFCNDPSEHLGFSLSENYFRCWRCGWKDIVTTISKLTQINNTSVRKIIKEYGGTIRKPVDEPKPRFKPFKLPSNTKPLTGTHKAYLQRRGFDAKELEREWGLISTGPASFLDDYEYSHRILAPIYWNGKQVSFQTRTHKGRVIPKYKACHKEREVIHHQEILYGNQEKWQEIGICVEGITDVWRLGPTAFATFGMEVTTKQIEVIAKSFKKVVVIFDNESQAQKQADKLVGELQFRGIGAKKITLTKSDPGTLEQNEVDYLVKMIHLQYFSIP